MPQSAWFTGDPRDEYPKLERDLNVDVGIVGGGITGATTAYLLKKAGLRVALVDRRRCGDGETGHTTAHLTYVTDERLHKLHDHFSRDVARAVWGAGLAAMELVEQIVEEENIDCAFTRLPGYLHAPWDAAEDHDRSGLQRDFELAQEFGLSPLMLHKVPTAGLPGVGFPDQAIFHPLMYLAGLLRSVDGGGSHVLEHTNVDDVDEHSTLHCGEHRIRCKHVVVATHVPLMGKSGLMQAALLQTRLAAYNSYAVSAKLPVGTAEQALYWDTSDPYYYLRIEDRGDFQTAIFGGQDHKTGQESNTESCYDRLIAQLHKIFPGVAIDNRWSGQVIETNDHLPLIGETAKNQFVATGFAGNGLTFGSFAGIMIHDAIMKQTNAWHDLFAPSRVHLRGGTWSYLQENSDFPRYLVRDRLRKAECKSLDDVPRGAGRILELDGAKVAAYHSQEGEVHCVSAVCPHMGCLVHWNKAEETWDCPCHGSRFGTDGALIAGPAETPLEQHKPATARHS